MRVKFPVASYLVKLVPDKNANKLYYSIQSYLHRRHYMVSFFGFYQFTIQGGPKN